ncbi:uncharacterized protein TNCV_4646921 [Trichonephila clavipes]|uniref:Uncharacterized protein n=1 Tax=Trichonephila clavipes TaxID=2585209 RepID=A0A8X6VMY6_TRICX|nr:uncharacterized protein TNCV_4646921 [Trichonephila clavipes]
MHDAIRSGIEAYKFCIMSRDISFPICCNLASSSFKLTGCPTHRPKWCQICSIGDKYRDRAGQERGQRTHILGGDQGYTPEIMDEILTTAKDLELEVNEDDIEELIMGHEDELTSEELQEILNEEHQETQRNVSPSEQEEDERGPMPTSAIEDLLKKWADVRAMVLKWHPNQADVSRVGDLYNNNAINYFWKILKKREKQSTLDMFFNAP